ncbi:MAG: V-type ATP synthase subunit A [Actinobacteria bacterium]|nr:V-type ATP synthase subunit A [Actinomycetota bacterium]
MRSNEVVVGSIKRVSGPLVVAEGLSGAKMFDLVKVGDEGLVGEIIEMRSELAFIQVYETTDGLKPGDKVVSTGKPLSVELGPGLLGTIYDGVERPLKSLEEKWGHFIIRGAEAPALDRKKKWHFMPKVKPGDEVEPGDIIGEVQETINFVHRIMIPPNAPSGVVEEIYEGGFSVEETICVIRTKGGEKFEVKMLQEWPVRIPRPFKSKLMPSEPLVCGQRVIDTFFPLVKGGTACIPGPFGSGKTVTQHQLAKWSNSDIVVFVGCGERGNEMTDVLLEFPTLEDPYTGRPLMERTVLIANTSNMPVAAREASIYTGIAIAEYFRDMGYDVTLQADSTSRWAEALREISGRLEEMPGEEGYPAYLTSRLAAFYERAGVVQCLGKPERKGSITAIGSVSPPGGDLSEPVVQATLRVVKVFWALEDRLAYERHFPAINWLNSYSLYLNRVASYYDREVASDFSELIKEGMSILQKEDELKEIVRLVGIEALSGEERILLETARSIREDFLQQNAFHSVDSFTSLKKQYLMLKNIISFYRYAVEEFRHGLDLETILNSPVRVEISRMKFVPESEIETLEKIEESIRSNFKRK